MKKILILIISAYSLSFGADGEAIINLYGCLECHGIKSGKTAPSFIEISKIASKEQIKHSIRNGSQGKYKKYAQNIMPEFNYFTNKELDNIATWIKSFKHEK